MIELSKFLDFREIRLQSFGVILFAGVTINCQGGDLLVAKRAERITVDKFELVADTGVNVLQMHQN